VQFNFGRNWGLVADGKYVPLRASTTAVYTAGGQTVAKFKINPAIFSAGLAVHF
jgi:outer membrane protein W